MGKKADWCTAVIVGPDFEVVIEGKVDFDLDLGQYGTKNGVLSRPEEREVFASVAMFLEAIDLVLRRLSDQGADLDSIEALSGAGMQHGTVFWSQSAEPLLAGLNSSKTLLEQLQGAFSHPLSPNWQDSSTHRQCGEFNTALESAEMLARVTGSSAHHVGP